MNFVSPDNCDCYECSSPKIRHINGHRTVMNNVKHHTFTEPCEKCGNPKSEYRDLGRKGYYECWHCNKRTAGPKEIE